MSLKSGCFPTAVLPDSFGPSSTSLYKVPSLEICGLLGKVTGLVGAGFVLATPKTVKSMQFLGLGVPHGTALSFLEVPRVMLAALALLLIPTSAEDGQCLLQRSAQQHLATGSKRLGQTCSEFWVFQGSYGHPTCSKWLVGGVKTQL